MAQPLFKRTFSRLRGKSRSRRKTEPQVGDVPVQCDVILQSSGPPLQALKSKSRKAAAAAAPRAPSSSPTIDTTKRQRRVGQGSESPSAPPNVDAPTSAQDEAGSRPAGGAAQANATAGTELSGKRAYLQSLDRSSRDWVLSSGNCDARDEARGRRRGSAGDIWYNPIPEEEDPAGQVWLRREPGPGPWPGPTEGKVPREAPVEAEGSAAESPGEKTCLVLMLFFPGVVELARCLVGLDSQPGVSKRGGVMDRLRSPGTARKLSLKMRKLPELRRKLSLRSSRVGQESDGAGGGVRSANKNAHDSNVLSRYHLDSSAPPALTQRRSSRVRWTGKGGYLSDGDSPEPSPRRAGDLASFPMYVSPEAWRCCRGVTGLLTVHLLGLEQMATRRPDEGKEVFLAIQIDGATRARTSLLPLGGHGLPLNHTFHLDLERARQLRVAVLRPAARSEPDRIKNRVCGLGGLAIPPLFKAGTRSQRLRVQLEPRGLLYIRLSLQEQWDTQFGGNSAAPAHVFGVELRRLVEEEGSARAVPLLIQKTVAEIERRGLKAVGLYRLCGSAAVKKELRDRFESDSSAVRLGEDRYPDINVITGILKDYLRELPSSLITATLYEGVREAMGRRPPPAPPAGPEPRLAESTVELLSCLPAAERATLTLLLDHLSLVAHFSSCNRMTHQNLAVCFGPVLLKQTREAWRGCRARGGPNQRKVLRPGKDSDGSVDFKHHIEALHYLLQLWPVPTHRIPADAGAEVSPPPSPDGRPLSVEEGEVEVVVSRRGRDGAARLDGPPPINRYAGDWSICGQQLAPGREADYDEVAASESGGGGGGGGDDDRDDKNAAWFPGAGGRALYGEDVLDFDAPFNCRLSLKDFDSLINDLDRELGKRVNICM